MSLWTLVGVLASASVVLSWVPQIVRILRTRSAEDISVGLPMLLIVGSALWVAYGVHLDDVIIMTVNSVVLAFNVFMLVLKRRYGHSNP